MLGSCNHIAGVLFRVEDSVKRGQTTTSCTDKLSVWNVPKVKVTIKPTKAKDLMWRKGHYTKLAVDKEDETKKAKLKQAFTPLSKTQEDSVKDEAAMRAKVYETLRDVVPDALFIGNYEKRRNNKPVVKLPTDYTCVAQKINENENMSQDEKVNAFKAHLTVSDEEHANIKEATIEQSQSETNREMAELLLVSFTGYQRKLILLRRTHQQTLVN
jgi:hypothetical protein